MTRLQELYRSARLPAMQNRMFHTETDARNCIRGDVVLVQDLSTGLIFNNVFDPDLLQYDADYQNEQAVSTVFQEHLVQVADIVDRHFKGRTLIEVGCGKAHFLEYLREGGFDVIGFDPTYEGTNSAVRREFFSPKAGAQAGGLILRHVLEHIPAPVEFLRMLRDTNGGSGRIYIEVPCFDWICEHRSWFDIFYEHVNYFRISDFPRMFGTVLETGRVFGGQYLYVVAELASVRAPGYCNEPFSFPADFLETVHSYARRLRDARPRAAAVWGGASKGVIFSLFMENAGAAVDIVIDINPAKRGKFLPATGLKVRSPDEAVPLLGEGADICVMNRNYLTEIRAMTGNAFNYIVVDDGIV